MINPTAKMAQNEVLSLKGADLSLVLIVVLLTVSVSSQPGFPVSTMRRPYDILTFNAAMFKRFPEYENRKNRLISFLRNTDYDAVCLQEVWYLNDALEIERSVPWMTTLIGQNSDSVVPITPPCLTTDVAYFFLVCGIGLLRNGAIGGNILDVGFGVLNCVIESGIIRVSQSCISCIINSDINAFNFCTQEGGQTTAMNIPGVVLMSKHRVIRAKTVYYEPNVKLIFPRAFLQAEIEGIGTVVCSHNTANLGPRFQEINLQRKFSSYEEQNFNEAVQLVRMFERDPRVIIMGDFNSGPEIRSRGITDLFPESYRFLRNSGYADPYIDDGGICTFCADNPFLSIFNTSSALDHIFTRGFVSLGSNRLLDAIEPVPLSDHYAVEVRVVARPSRQEIFRQRMPFNMLT